MKFNMKTIISKNHTSSVTNFQQGKQLSVALSRRCDAL